MEVASIAESDLYAPGLCSGPLGSLWVPWLYAVGYEETLRTPILFVGMFFVYTEKHISAYHVCMNWATVTWKQITVTKAILTRYRNHNGHSKRLQNPNGSKEFLHCRRCGVGLCEDQPVWCKSHNCKTIYYCEPCYEGLWL